METKIANWIKNLTERELLQVASLQGDIEAIHQLYARVQPETCEQLGDMRRSAAVAARAALVKLYAKESNVMAMLEGAVAAERRAERIHHTRPEWLELAEAVIAEAKAVAS